MPSLSRSGPAGGRRRPGAVGGIVVAAAGDVKADSPGCAGCEQGTFKPPERTGLPFWAFLRRALDLFRISCFGFRISGAAGVRTSDFELPAPRPYLRPTNTDAPAT